MKPLRVSEVLVIIINEKGRRPFSIGQKFFVFGRGLGLPQESGDRVRLLKDDPAAYVRSLTHEELVRVVEGVARSGPLSEHDVDRLLDERYPVVSPEFMPEEKW